MTNHAEAAPRTLDLALFAPHVDSLFEIAIADDRFALRLAEATALRQYSPDPQARAPFSLVFVCPDLRVLPQGSYAMDHAIVGRVDLFIVPIGQRPDGIEYEALFN
ncbi:MAG: hypothetical protein KGL44_02395 [Sphingomonadales bacterium]|nr:hypothetical protein [Sphingomonadales bacterium]